MIIDMPDGIPGSWYQRLEDSHGDGTATCPHCKATGVTESSRSKLFPDGGSRFDQPETVCFALHASDCPYALPTVDEDDEQ